MSKELEALQKLRDLVENLTRIDYVPTDLRNEVKELLINSYEDSNGYFSLIEKALKRNEPMKVIFTRIGNIETEISWDEPTCPRCKSLVSDAERFCSKCEQKLDWGKYK